MFRVLLNKQMQEIFRSWFYHSKTGLAKTKARTVGTALLFLCLIVGLIGGMFAFFAILMCQSLFDAGVDWLYFTIFGLISIVLGLFGSVFNTYSCLYLAKDNDMLLSMPVTPSVIILSRIFSVYCMGALYSLPVFLPAIIVYQVTVGWNFLAFLSEICMWLEITLVVLSLSCLLGWVVAKVGSKLKRKSFVSVILSLAFIGAYYFVYFKAQLLIQNITKHAAEYGATVQGSAYFLCVWGKNGVGDFISVALCFGACALLTGLVWLVLSRTFIKMATTVPSDRIKGNRSTYCCKSVHATLLAKEFRRYAASSNYILNCTFGALILTILGVLLLIKGNEWIVALTRQSVFIASSLPVLYVSAAALAASMNDSAAPSVSLEGKNVWMMQSLPIPTWWVLRAKLEVQLILTGIPMLFFNVCAWIVLSMTPIEKLLCFLSTVVIVLIEALFDLFIGIKTANTTWTNELVPIKQSMGIGIVLFSGWGYAVIPLGGVYLLSVLSVPIGAVNFLGIFTIVSAVLSFVLYRWLKTAGADRFRTL